MKAFGKCVAAGAVACFLNPVHAVEQHWHLTAIVEYVSAGATGSFAALGRQVDVDYFIDSTSGAVSSISFNNEMTDSHGDEVRDFSGGLIGLNSYISSRGHQRQDGATFVSFYNTGAGTYNSASGILAALSAGAGSGTEKIRFSYGENSVRANVTSFAVSTVPEPSAAMLALLGASAVFAGKRRVKKKSQTA